MRMNEKMNSSVSNPGVAIPLLFMRNVVYMVSPLSEMFSARVGVNATWMICCSS